MTSEVNEKVKPLKLKDTETGAEYTLEFNREAIRFAEARGFDIDELAKYPMTRLPELFFYAFRMHHKNVSRERTDKILFEDLGGIPDGMMERLWQLYNEPFNALMQNDEGEEEVEAKKHKVIVEF